METYSIVSRNINVIQFPHVHEHVSNAMAVTNIFVFRKINYIPMYRFKSLFDKISENRCGFIISLTLERQPSFFHF